MLGRGWSPVPFALMLSSLTLSRFIEVEAICCYYFDTVEHYVKMPSSYGVAHVYSSRMEVGDWRVNVFAENEHIQKG